MKPEQTLNDLINQKADAELNRRLNEAFGSLEKWAYEGLHSGNMVHVESGKLSGGGSMDFKKEVWPPHAVDVAKACLFHGLMKSNREKALKEFLAKVDRLEAEIGEIRDMTNA